MTTHSASFKVLEDLYVLYDWQIEDLSHPYLCTGLYLESPSFPIVSEMWHLGIEVFPTTLNVYLARERIEDERNVLCSIGLKSSMGIEIGPTKIYFYRNMCRDRCVWNQIDRLHLEPSTTFMVNICRNTNMGTAQTLSLEKDFAQFSNLTFLESIKEKDDTTEKSEKKNEFATPSCTTCLQNIKEKCDNIEKVQVSGESTTQVSSSAPANSKEKANTNLLSQLDSMKTWIKNFEGLFLSERQSDIQLKVENQTFPAHKLILSVQSSVFEAMFQYSDMAENKSGVVEIADCDEQIFKDFLYFMYTGDCSNVSTSNAVGLYMVAEKYNVQQLKVACRSKLIHDISVEVVLNAVHLASLYEEIEIMKKASQIFINNAEDILPTEKWKTFLVENTGLANELLLKMAKNLKEKPV